MFKSELVYEPLSNNRVFTNYSRPIALRSWKNLLFLSLVILILLTFLYVSVNPKQSKLEKNVKSSAEKTYELFFFHKRRNLTRTVDVTKLPLFPKEDPTSDRIANQLIYRPPNYEDYAKDLPIEKYKKISIVEGLFPKGFWKGFYYNGTDMFRGCPVSTCIIDNNDTSTADLVMYKGHPSMPKSHPHQIRLLFELEGPCFIKEALKNDLIGDFEWISTYRHDSDIPTPYGKWLYYNDLVRQQEQTENYAAGKTKKIAWIVSNCNAYNKRMEIAKELRKYLPVDIWGKCIDQNLTCPKGDFCLKMLQNDYKFYLAFENANCVDYITEKTFKSFRYKVLPIIMGAHPEECRNLLPERSFVHVDDFESIEHLGTYLQLLDQDDTLYNSYFRWRETGEDFDCHGNYFCRLCSMLHNPNIIDLSKTALFNTTLEAWLYRDCQKDTWNMKFNSS